MANSRSIPVTISLTIISIALTAALYEDQVGKFDWKRPLLGKVKHARFDNKRLFVTTHENVVASLSLKTDHIVWRQLMESPPQQPHLLHLDKDLITVSGSPTTFYVRGWDAPTGSLLWEWSNVGDRSADSFWAINGEVLVQVVPIPGSHIEVAQYNVKTGASRSKMRKTEAPWVGAAGKCAMANPYLVCISNGQFFWLDVASEESKVNSHSIQSVTGESESGSLQLLEFEGPKPAVLLVGGTSARLVNIEASLVRVSEYSLPPNSVCIDNAIFHLEANLDNPQKLITVKSQNLHSGQLETSLEVDYPLGLGGPYIVAGQCRGPSCDLLLCSTDNALTLLRLPEGKPTWTREEALASIVAVAFSELPASELDVSIEHEFTTSTDTFTMLSHRLATQTRQLSNLLLGGQLLADHGLVRDDFGLHKVVVVATAVGKLFGLDTLTGSIVWSYRLPNVQPFASSEMLLLVQRTARYSPLPAQSVLLAKDAATGLGVMFTFDPITGASGDGVQRLDYRVKQALLLPCEDDSHVKPVLVIADDDALHVYPREAHTLARRQAGSIFVYTVAGSVLKGFRLTPSLHLGQVWEVNLGPSQLVALSTRPVNERVHSQGRVLPDRSVYYKYVNPNLVALATVSEDPVHRHVVSVYLVDGVTGLVLYSTSHKRARGPVHLVHSENWLVYTLYNERFRRHEVAAAELYEGHLQSNSTAFSSFGVSQLPHVQTQSYILPASPVAMGVTVTERGVSSKFLLVGTTAGNVVELPWALLQPRVGEAACGPEESCVPYMPEAPLPAEAAVNYNQSLGRISGVAAAPARLESTSHVLVHGLDLFYTRVAPSKTFDVLKEDFDHRLIVLVLAGLVLAAYVTKFLAARKGVRQAWK